MGWLVAPTEPTWLKTIGKVSMASERWGGDLMNPELKIIIQRKELSDLITSAADGRLAQQVQQMRPMPWRFLLVEGQAKWSSDGDLIGNRWQQFTKRQFNSLMTTIQLDGVIVLFSSDATDTLQTIDAIEKYVRKPEHSFLNTRPKNIQSDWGVINTEDYQSWVLQSWPGISDKLARRIIKHVGFPMQLSVTPEQLLSVPGLGEGKVKAILKCMNLNGVEVKKKRPSKPKVASKSAITAASSSTKGTRGTGSSKRKS